MNTRIIKIIMVLVAVVAVGGCSSISTQPSLEANDRPILSAAQARSMIHVTVRTLEPSAAEKTLVAAHND
jgi:hypothetical protein